MRLPQLQRLVPSARQTSRANSKFQDFPCAILQNEINGKRNRDPLNYSIEPVLSVDISDENGCDRPDLRNDRCEKESAALSQKSPFAPQNRSSRGSGKQIQDRFALAIAGHVERAFLNFVGEPWRDAHRPEKGGVEVFDDDALLNRLERTLVRGSAVQIALLDPAAEEQHAAGVREMPVHPVILLVVNHVGHRNLVFDLLVRLSFDQRVAAELAGQDDQRPVQQTALLKVENEL